MAVPYRSFQAYEPGQCNSLRGISGFQGGIGTTDSAFGGTLNPNKVLQGFYLFFWMLLFISTRNPAIAEGPRDAGVPVEIW